MDYAEPSFLAILAASGRMAYIREDGVIQRRWSNSYTHRLFRTVKQTLASQIQKYYNKYGIKSKIIMIY